MTTERTQQHIYELNTESRLTKLESTNEMILKVLVDINQSINKLDNRLWTLIFLLASGFVTGIFNKVFHWF